MRKTLLLFIITLFAALLTACSQTPEAQTEYVYVTNPCDKHHTPQPDICPDCAVRLDPALPCPFLSSGGAAACMASWYTELHQMENVSVTNKCAQKGCDSSKVVAHRIKTSENMSKKVWEIWRSKRDGVLHADPGTQYDMVNMPGYERVGGSRMRLCITSLDRANAIFYALDELDEIHARGE